MQATMRRQMPQVDAADAWGSEEETEMPATPWRAPPAKQAQAAGKAAAAGPPARQPAAAAAAAPQHHPLQQGRRHTGPHSLHAICLGVLAEHLDELIECGEDVLPLLPAPAKACLLAVARLRRLVSNAALALLADAEQSILDLHGCGDLVSSEGILAAVQGMPHLRLVDLTSCPVGPATLRALGAACPAVEVLRLGSPATDESCGRALRDILPALEERQQAPAAESWDALAADDPAALAALAGRGRLMQLRCIAWPNIPYRVEQHCRSACPAVALNPSAEEVARRRLAPACDPATQLDAPLLAEVAGSERWERQPEAPPPQHVVHIAEKFRQAYISRQQRIKALEERRWQQEQRRRERERSKADRLIEQWESEL